MKFKSKMWLPKYTSSYKKKKNDKMLKGGTWALATYQLKIRELTSHESKN